MRKLYKLNFACEFVREREERRGKEGERERERWVCHTYRKERKHLVSPHLPANVNVHHTLKVKLLLHQLNLHLLKLRRRRRRQRRKNITIMMKRTVNLQRLLLEATAKLLLPSQRRYSCHTASHPFWIFLLLLGEEIEFLQDFWWQWGTGVKDWFWEDC